MTNKPKWLKRAAHRSSEHSWTLGAALDEYCRTEGLTREQLSLLLGCNTELLAWLSLCRKPRFDHFADDIARIAERFQIDATKLAQMMRRVDAISALRRTIDTDEAGPLLLAARDRDKKRKK